MPPVRFTTLFMSASRMRAAAAMAERLPDRHCSMTVRSRGNSSNQPLISDRGLKMAPGMRTSSHSSASRMSTMSAPAAIRSAASVASVSGIPPNRSVMAGTIVETGSSMTGWRGGCRSRGVPPGSLWA